MMSKPHIIHDPYRSKLNICGTIDFNSLFSSDHPLLFDIDILRLLGYPVQGTDKSIERDIKLNEPHLVEVYQACLFQQHINHNAAARIESLYIVDITAWLPGHENKLNQIDRDVERSMKCAANSCRCKSYKNHKWTDEFTRGIYCIRNWCLRRKMLNNINTINDSAQTPQLYDVKSCIIVHDDNQI
jgi:hypothetical protein